MYDGDPVGCLWGWPRASFRQWLVGLGAIAALMAVLYLVFSWLGWS